MHDHLTAGTADTILVVDDEVLIRMVIADYLRDCGYRVFEAGSVDEAVEVLHNEPRIDLVFSDIQMPGGRDGCHLARWVADRYADVEVILTSGGWSAADLAEDLCHAGPLIGKPYHLDAVADRIRAVLGERGDPVAAEPAAMN